MFSLYFLNDSDPELVFLTDGASKGVMQMLNTIIRGEGDGVTANLLSLLIKLYFYSYKLSLLGYFRISHVGILSPFK